MRARLLVSCVCLPPRSPSQTRGLSKSTRTHSPASCRRRRSASGRGNSATTCELEPQPRRAQRPPSLVDINRTAVIAGTSRLPSAEHSALSHWRRYDQGCDGQGPFYLCMRGRGRLQPETKYRDCVYSVRRAPLVSSCPLAPLSCPRVLSRPARVLVSPRAPLVSSSGTDRDTQEAGRGAGRRCSSLGVTRLELLVLISHGARTPVPAPYTVQP